MASSNLEIDNGVVKDDLNCVKCKSLPKDACLVPCGCRLCRICINDLIATGVRFCPGSWEECGGSPLSQSVADYRANRNISKLPFKCPNKGCVHACQLPNMKDHLRVCPRKSMECPFRELGCTQDKLAAEEMSDHLQRESLSHNEILIGMINNVNNEMEGGKREIEMLKEKDKRTNKEIEMLHKSYSKAIEMLKSDLELKNRQIKSIMEAIKSIKIENKESIDKMKSTREDIDLSQVTSNTKMTEYVDKEVKAIKKDIQSINQGTQTIKADIDSIKKQMPTGDSLAETVLEVLLSAFQKHKNENSADRDGKKNVGGIGIRQRGRIRGRSHLRNRTDLSEVGDLNNDRYDPQRQDITYNYSTPTGWTGFSPIYRVPWKLTRGSNCHMSNIRYNVEGTTPCNSADEDKGSLQ